MVNRKLMFHGIYLAVIATLLLLLVNGYLQTADAADTLFHPSVSVYFSPDGGCTKAIVQELDSAKHSIYLQAYSFTSIPITEAIISAEERGVKVRAILDHSQENARSSQLPALLDVHIPVLIDHVHKIAHNKIMIIDGHDVLTGSFNFTESAEYDNAENVLILHDKALAARYQQDWNVQAEICQPAHDNKHIQDSDDFPFAE